MSDWLKELWLISRLRREKATGYPVGKPVYDGLVRLIKRDLRIGNIPSGRALDIVDGLKSIGEWEGGE